LGFFSKKKKEKRERKKKAGDTAEEGCANCGGNAKSEK
jgi:hypothetical protein